MDSSYRYKREAFTETKGPFKFEWAPDSLIDLISTSYTGPYQLIFLHELVILLHANALKKCYLRGTISPPLISGW